MNAGKRSIRKRGGIRRAKRGPGVREPGRCPLCGLGIAVGVQPMRDDGAGGGFVRRFTCGHRIVREGRKPRHSLPA